MTTDVKITQDPETYIWDLSLSGEGDLENGDFFDSSLIYSLLGERRASESEVPISEYRRGWIGNEGKNFENGSKLWLYDQSRLTRTTMNGVADAALDAVSWMVEDGILKDVQTRSMLIGGRLHIEISLIRYNSKVERRYFNLWQNTGVN